MLQYTITQILSVSLFAIRSKLPESRTRLAFPRATEEYKVSLVDWHTWLMRLSPYTNLRTDEDPTLTNLEDGFGIIRHAC